MSLLKENKTANGNGHWSSPDNEKFPVVVMKKPEFVASRKRQYLAALIPTIGSFSLGTVLAWSAPALPDLQVRQDLGELSGDEETWIASLAVLGALMSGFIVGVCINKFGRKRTMLAIAFPFVLGWALIAFAQNLAMMYAGRFITGFTGGCFTVIVPVYISESVEDNLRGILGSAMILMLVTGILFAFSVAAFVSWFWLSVICAQFPILLFFMLLFVPETPRFLLLKGHTKRATDSLKWLRGATEVEQIEFEFAKLRNSIETNNRTGTSYKKLFSPSVLKPTGISLALMFFQQLGGINAVCFYTVDILKVANPNFDANIASIIIGIVQVVFVLSSMFLVDRFGRKVFLVTSDVIMGLSLTALGLFFYFKQQTETNTHSSMAFIPLISLISFIIAYSAGAGPLPWLLMSEILPPNVKDMASGIVTSFYWLLAFVATKTFRNLITLLGDHGCYWLYAAICIAGAIFTIIVVPETKGKSSEEIQRYFGASVECSKQSEALFSQEEVPYHEQKPSNV